MSFLWLGKKYDDFIRNYVKLGGERRRNRENGGTFLLNLGGGASFWEREGDIYFVGGKYVQLNFVEEDFIFRIFGFIFRISGFILQISGFNFRISGLLDTGYLENILFSSGR